MRIDEKLPALVSNNDVAVSPQHKAEQQTAIGSFVPMRPTAELEKISALLTTLLEIRASPEGVLNKVKRTVQAVARISVIGPVLGEMAKVVKRHGWDNRNRSSRVLIWTSAAAAATFGGQAAGIAALGTAISVPLWIVFGSGAMFAEMLVSQIAGELEARRQAERVREGIVDGVFSVLS